MKQFQQPFDLLTTPAFLARSTFVADAPFTNCTGEPNMHRTEFSTRRVHPQILTRTERGLEGSPLNGKLEAELSLIWKTPKYPTH
jgi:hypothetical protein